MASALRPAISELFVVRTAGLPRSAADVLRAPQAVDALQRLVDIGATIALYRDAVSAALHTAIGAHEPSGQRNHLLALRRALYNGRLPSAAARAAASGLPPSVQDSVNRYCVLLAQHAEAVDAVRRAYTAELRATRARFQEAIQDTDFVNGLVLSSATLADNRRRYVTADPAAMNSRDEHIERGLLRYFTRATMKATPFGAFCAIGEGGLVTDGGPPAGTFTSDPRIKQSAVRLNKALFAILWTRLKTYPPIRRALVVTLNSTVEHEGGRLRFLAGTGLREVFQRVTCDESLDMVLASVGQHGAPYGQLVSQLAAHPDLEVTAAEAESYVDRLLRIGLLRFRGVVSEQEADWDVPLLRTLDAIADDRVVAIAGLLRKFRALADAYGLATVEGREAAFAEMRATVLALFDALGIKNTVPRDLPIFEDTGTAARLELPRSDGLERALQTVAELATLGQQIGAPRSEQATMRHFFDATYGSQSVSLLRFYEDFHREHQNRHLIKQREARLAPGRADPDGYDVANPFALQRVQAIREAHLRIFHLIRNTWAAAPDAEELSISLDALRKAAGELAHERRGRAWSSAIFCQVIPAAGDLPARVFVPDGHFHVGYGKYFSRFLYLLPTESQRAVFDANTKLSADWLAEIGGDAHFNANLHPPLLARVIGSPTAEAPGAEWQLEVPDLDVRPDPHDAHSLRLVHRPTGTTVVPADLGFLNLMRRPPLYQLLANFSASAHVKLALPQLLEAPRSDDPQIVHRPRMTIEGRVVVARHRWRIPSSLMPRLQAGEAQSDYYIRVDAWRRQHGIPAEVYARVVAEPPRRVDDTGAADGPGTRDGSEPEGDDDELREAPVAVEATDPRARRTTPPPPSRGWGKPQYIEFGSPLLLALFSRMPGAIKEFRLELEEVYPASEALPRFGDEAYVTEYVMQIHAPELRATEPLLMNSPQPMEAAYA